MKKQKSESDFLSTKFCYIMYWPVFEKKTREARADTKKLN